jgi:regulation of enolase protein 1 (concanavalin A-like superfamily)
MHKGGGTIRFGVYACSPEASSFKATFTNLKMTDCQWPAHNGQKPDEE